MGKLSKILQLVLHPTEFKAALQFFVFKQKLHSRDVTKESETLKQCYYLLSKTSRSFYAVILELHPELRDAIMLFYLILRALDTVEDDMTIDPKIKVPLLRSFSEKLDLEKWSFDGNGPNEKDRMVLVKFNAILTEYHQLKPQYQKVIKDITHKMGNGMADYILDENFNLNGVGTVKDYDLYCYYVAGLVGEGLTNLIVLAKFSNESLNDKMDLAISMGLFLQKTNIIRDYREDLEDKRSFWPKEIWSKYTQSLPDFADPKNAADGLDCTSDLVLNALGHVTDVLTYLSLIKDQSTFNFCAIPQVMAIATLDLVYQNPEVFQTNVKIRKGTTLKLIVQCRTLEGVADIFSRYIRSINHKSHPSNKNYLKIGIMCGQIEQFIEGMYPLRNLPKEITTPPKSPILSNILERSHVEIDMKAAVRIEEEKTQAALVGFGLALAVVGYLVYATVTGESLIAHLDL
ncbi:bifunctional farnesyl-diphosphate farnesyltransferase/squalene synthase [Saccharomycopsis crataegensis]|uniref:Squalene synthase n=1 Tax=Saccharomycopsis crataegensis TaxID=43959 RepID=A0AAV5QJL3_9ASCO|nr:bifunctional farnesyl-diphosphate farnesyltransferase/squalene synthase [Saccharomycopsis crataegensis]